MMPKPAPTTRQKRKAPEGSQATDSLARKRQKTQAIRTIPSQSTDAALSATGELDVAAFVKAREYEINTLEKSMQNSRHGLTTRAFQQIPRNMRRRTASHNVKKVPRRLRRRAEREVSDMLQGETGCWAGGQADRLACC
jgi:ribonuclease P/MRP protein subunit POP1